jgi:hypothetical protein
MSRTSLVGRDSDRSFLQMGLAMKRSTIYEIVARVLALGGTLLFGFAIFPLVNPTQWRLNFGADYLPAVVISLVVSVLIMWMAWRLSRKAQQLKQDEQTKG